MHLVGYKNKFITMPGHMNVKFRIRLLPPSSRYMKYLKIKASNSFEALVTSYQAL